MSHIKKFTKELLRCYKCGNCQAFCPNFENIHDESAVARGLLALIEAQNDGLLDFTDKFVDLLYQCPSCWQCVDNCPSGVRFDKLLLAARGDYLESSDISHIKYKINSNKNSLAFQTIRESIIPHLPKNSIFAQLFGDGSPSKSELSLLSDKLPEQSIPPNTTPQMDVGLFVGCLADFEITQKTIQLLSINDIETIIPQKQTCGGDSLLNFGDFPTAKFLIQQNINAFSERNLDTIITISQKDKWMLTEGLNFLDLKSSFTVYNLWEFYHKIITKKPADTSLTNRLSLSEIPFSDPIFQVLNPDLSKKYIDKVIQKIKLAKEKFITHDNPYILKLLNEKLTQENIPFEVHHPVELLLKSRS